MSVRIKVFESRAELAKAAGAAAAERIEFALRCRGEACIVAATGTSQLGMLRSLVRESLDWPKTIFFHLDEYVGLPETHPASFRRYLKEQIAEKVRPGEFHFIQGDHPDPTAECRRLKGLLAGRQLDLALVGIGENGHLAFNDPPADFETDEPFLLVDLDDACRKQQLGEGWFRSLDDVPRRAISMSVRQILKAEHIICTVPDLRKARAVKNCLEREVSPLFPASILRQHSDVVLFLDREAASLLHPGF